MNAQDLSPPSKNDRSVQRDLISETLRVILQKKTVPSIIFLCTEQRNVASPEQLGFLCLSFMSAWTKKWHIQDCRLEDKSYFFLYFLALYFDLPWPIINCFTQVSNGQECTVILLDSQGIDAVCGESLHDIRILVLTVLLASGFIYNSGGVPCKTCDLQHLEYPFTPLFSLLHDLRSNRLRQSNSGTSFGILICRSGFTLTLNMSVTTNSSVMSVQCEQRRKR